jgi:transposase InsO family protein
LVRKRRRKAQTTFSRQRFEKYANPVRNYEPLAPSLLWVSDKTYLEVADGFAYLSLTTDAYSKKIQGFYLSKNLNARCPCFETASQEVIKAIWVYNSLRPHFSCDMLTPVQAHHKEERLKTLEELLQNKGR